MDIFPQYNLLSCCSDSNLKKKKKGANLHHRMRKLCSINNVILEMLSCRVLSVSVYSSSLWSHSNWFLRCLNLAPYEANFILPTVVPAVGSLSWIDSECDKFKRLLCLNAVIFKSSWAADGNFSRGAKLTFPRPAHEVGLCCISVAWDRIISVLTSALDLLNLLFFLYLAQEEPNSLTEAFNC